MNSIQSLASIDFISQFDSNSSTTRAYHSERNVCLPIQDHIFDYVDLIPVQAGFTGAYSLVFLLGLLTNCATLRCLIWFELGVAGAISHNSINSNGKRSVKFGVSPEFLISLTLADLVLICCTSLPLTAIHIFSRRWLLGEYGCKIGPLLQGVGCFVTSFSLTAIAVERYSMVANGKSKVSPKTKISVVVSIWILAVASSLPLAFAYKLRRECIAGIGCFCGEFCDEIGWTSEFNRTSYGIAAFMLQYVLPACVLAFCYYKVRQRVEQGVRKRLQREHISLISQQRLSRRKTRTSCMTLLLFAGFVCPWLPMCVMNLLRDFNHLPEDWYAVAFAGSHLIAMTSILYNPIVYCWANRYFRSAFMNALFCGHADSCIANSYGYHDDDDEYDDRQTATAALSAPTASTFEPSIRRKSDNSYRSFPSGRLSSHSSGRRSRLGTIGSLGVPRSNSKSRPSSWQFDAGIPMLTVPTVECESSNFNLSATPDTDADSVAV